MWGISGDIAAAAGGAADAMDRLNDQRRQDEQLKAQLAQQLFEQQIRQAEHNERVRTNDQQRRRQEQADKINLAGANVEVADSMFDPASRTAPAELPSELIELLTGTPYQARLDRKETLPARATTRQVAPMHGVADAERQELSGATVGAQRPYTVLSPTGAQQGQRRQLAVATQHASDLDRMSQDPATPAKLKTILWLRRVGVETAPVGSSLLETDSDRTAADNRAFQNFTRRENYQDGLIRGRQPAARAPSAKDAQKDRREALRAARRDAIAEFNARKDPITGPTADLDALIEEYEEDYLAVLDAVEADGSETAEPTRGGLVPVAPQLQGMPPKNGATNGRRVVRDLVRRQPTSAPASNTLRYDANGNRVK